MNARRLFALALAFAFGFAAGRVRPDRPRDPLPVGTRLVVHRPSGASVTGDGGDSPLTVTDHELTVYRVVGGPDRRPPDGVRVWQIDLGGETYFAAEPRRD